MPVTGTGTGTGQINTQDGRPDSARGVPTMLTIYSDDHRLHHGQHELIGGQFTPAMRSPVAPTWSSTGSRP
jgi:hypothetical protein